MAYNGYENKETWDVVAWIDNTPKGQDTRDHILRPYDSFADKVSHLEEWVSADYIEPYQPENSLASDLLTLAFSKVNWYEIVKAHDYIYEETN